jgi:hypothetical protein
LKLIENTEIEANRKYRNCDSMTPMAEGDPNLLTWYRNKRENALTPEPCDLILEQTKLCAYGVLL